MLHQDLIEQFESTVVPVLQSELTYTDAKTASFDERFMQASLPLNNPEIVFTSGGKVVDTYFDLEELSLSAEDLAAVEARKAQKNHSYDGYHILVKGLHQTNDKMELDVVRTRYSVVEAISSKSLPKESKLYTTTLYKCGVMSPFITTDGHAVFAERNADKLYSVASGLLLASGTDEILKDIVRNTAFSKCRGEFLDDENEDIRVGIVNKMEVKQVSFRKMKNGMGTVEFVAPCQLNCDMAQLEKIITDNEAPNAKDHTSNHFWVNFNGSAEEARTVLSGKAGKFLYNPILLGATTVAIADEAKRTSFVNDLLKPREIGGFIAHGK